MTISNDTPITVLIVEDEAAIREMVGFAMRRAGYKLQVAGDGQAAKQQLATDLPDIILLDWMLPDTSGIELIRYFKNDEITRHIPIIMLTARSDEADKIQGLETGADDYMVKPFSPKELVARIRAVLRRQNSNQSAEILVADKLTLDTGSHRVTIGTNEIHMGPTEFRLLHFFMNHQNRVYTRSQLLDHVWGRNIYIEDRTVDVHVLRLRKLLKPYNLHKLIQTVRSVGYRFALK